jgi:hypothetical protein
MPEILKCNLSQTLSGSWLLRGECPKCSHAIRLNEKEFSQVSDTCPHCEAVFAVPQKFIQRIREERADAERVRVAQAEKEKQSELEKREDEQERIRRAKKTADAKLAEEQNPLSSCSDCHGMISKKASKCVHCGAPRRDRTLSYGSSALLLILGVVIFYSNFDRNTTQNDVHNIGLLSDKLCAVLFGLFLVTWSVIIKSRN